MAKTSCMLRRAALAGAALLLAAPALAQRGGEPVRVGAVLSVTGPASFLGDPEDKTLRLYVDRINKAGGVNGRPLQLVAYDDGGDDARSVLQPAISAAASRLASPHTPAIERAAVMDSRLDGMEMVDGDGIGNGDGDGIPRQRIQR